MAVGNFVIVGMWQFRITSPDPKKWKSNTGNICQNPKGFYKNCARCLRICQRPNLANRKRNLRHSQDIPPNRLEFER